MKFDWIHLIKEGRDRVAQRWRRPAAALLWPYFRVWDMAGIIYRQASPLCSHLSALTAAIDFFKCQIIVWWHVHLWATERARPGRKTVEKDAGALLLSPSVPAQLTFLA
jgi:hypothetical protein